MTPHAILAALLWAGLLFAAICTVVGAIAFFIGGFLVYLAEREARRYNRKPRKNS